MANNIHQTEPSLARTLPSSDSEEFSSLFLHNSPVMDPNPSGSDFNTPHLGSSSLSSFNFSDPYANASLNDPHVNNTFKQHTVVSSQKHNHPCYFTCSIENAEISEFPSSKPGPPPRSSSKRSRAAEFHNLSEKRRRSRINEKMKALQNLIPNSNKTDKASMLDEAIEYLKQLQLQVQMLMMRNGLSLHPMSVSGGLRPMLLPQTGLNIDEGNGFQNSISAIPSSANDEDLVRPTFSFPEQCSISNQSVVIPSVTNIATLDTSSSFQPSIKDALCGNMPQLFLDTTKIGKTASPDVS